MYPSRCERSRNWRPGPRREDQRRKEIETEIHIQPQLSFRSKAVFVPAWPQIRRQEFVCGGGESAGAVHDA